MRIRYLESGGFAGLQRGVDLDTAHEAPAEAARLESLARAAASASTVTTTREPDAAQYVVTIEEGDRFLEIRFSDDSATPEEWRLRDALSARSRPTPP